MTKPRVLFLCTGNSCRSQMAEGLLRHMAREHVDVVSAGTEPRAVHPLAIQVMREAGIDISGQRSKGIDTFAGREFRFVITLCPRARERCPQWPDDVERIHWSVDDPASAASAPGDPERPFRKARDELRQRIALFLLANRLVPVTSAAQTP